MTFLAFFLFVAPGLLFDQLSARKRVKRRESTFTEISRVALISTVCSVTATALLAGAAAVMAWRGWKPFPVPSSLITQGSRYVADHVVPTAVTSLVFVVLSLLVSWVLFLLLHRKHKGGISYTSTWRQVMRVRAPEGTEVHVRAGMSDGSVWFGRVAEYSPDLEVADRELILAQPLATKPKPEQNTGEEPKPLPDRWTYMVLRGSDIVSLAVSYRAPRVDESLPAHKRRLGQLFSSRPRPRGALQATRTRLSTIRLPRLTAAGPPQAEASQAGGGTDAEPGTGRGGAGGQ
ncbi:DUF6338 family protein [Nocardia sp. CDC159]|nr:DUF6338 family protein [Nocardia sp. CDC159]